MMKLCFQFEDNVSTWYSEGSEQFEVYLWYLTLLEMVCGAIFELSEESLCWDSD
jgi:hypothetical protein